MDNFLFLCFGGATSRSNLIVTKPLRPCFFLPEASLSMHPQIKLEMSNIYIGETLESPSIEWLTHTHTSCYPFTNAGRWHKTPGSETNNLITYNQRAAQFASIPSRLEFLRWWHSRDPGGWFVGSSCRWGTLSLGNLPSHWEIKSYILQGYSL